MKLMGYSGMDLPEELIQQRFDIINKMKSLNKRGKKFGDGTSFTPGSGLNIEQGIIQKCYRELHKMLSEDEHDKEEYEKQKRSSDLGKKKLNQEDFII